MANLFLGIQYLSLTTLHISNLMVKIILQGSKDFLYAKEGDLLSLECDWDCPFQLLSIQINPHKCTQ